MKAYTNYVPTMFFYGRGSLGEHGKNILPRYGKRAYIITSRFIENRENIALKDACTMLESLGIEYGYTENVEENPPIRSLVAMMPEVRAFNPDFLIGIGGGSSIDSAKAVSVLLDYPAEDDTIEAAAKNLYEGSLPHEALYSHGKVQVFAVPTTAGTGAEVTAFSVVTNEDTHVKQAISHPVFCVAAFLDGRYIENAPDLILCTGAMDALAHAAESYVNKKSNQMNRFYAEMAFTLFAQVKDNLRNESLTAEDYDKLVMFSNISGMAFMRSGTTIPHGMGYALSTFKGVNHGLSCSVSLGEYLKVFKEPENVALVQRIVSLCGFNDLDDMCEYMSALIKRNMNITVTEEEINEWSVNFFNQKWRLTRHPEELDVDIIHGIYERSLSHYIVK